MQETVQPLDRNRLSVVVAVLLLGGALFRVIELPEQTWRLEPLGSPLEIHITGVWLLYLFGIPYTQGWVVITIALYLIAGACWLPVVWLQIRMRDLSLAAVKRGQPLTPRYYKHASQWFWLGIPAFTAMVIVYILMVFKPAL